MTSSSTTSAGPSAAAVQQSDNIAHALSGAGGGLLSMVLTYPLITLSTRAQVESSRSHTTVLAAVRHIIAREGASGLYSGLSSALFGISVTNFVYYYWYEWTRAFFVAAAEKAGRKSKRLTTVEAMIAGAIAGSATVLLTNPIWVVNTRVTTRKRARAASNADAAGEAEKGLKSSTTSLSASESVETPTPSTIGTLLALLKEEGPAALFSGVAPALVLVINPILQYTIFEQMKNFYEKGGGKGARRRVTPTLAFILGAWGKLVATSVTYPYITLKSRMHVAGSRKGAEKGEDMTAAMKRIIREEGWKGLYNGIGPKVTQSVLTAAFLFAFKDLLYEQTVKLRQKAVVKH